MLNLLHNQTLKLIRTELGFIGEAIVRAMLLLVMDEGYFADFGADSRLLFCHDNGITVEDVRGALDAAMRRRVFDAEMYEKYGILTSEELQTEFFKSAKRRKRLKVNENYILGKAYAKYCTRAEEKPEKEEKLLPEPSAKSDIAELPEASKAPEAVEICEASKPSEAVEICEASNAPEEPTKTATEEKSDHESKKSLFDGFVKRFFGAKYGEYEEEIRKRDASPHREEAPESAPRGNEFSPPKDFEAPPPECPEEASMPSEDDISDFESSCRDAPIPEECSWLMDRVYF